MWKRLVLAVSLCLGSLAPGLAGDLAAAPEIPPGASIRACSAIVYDLQHEAILFEQNADERIPPASLTKVMSMHLALDHLAAGHASMDSMVTVSPAAAATGGSRMGLVASEELPMKRLLQGMAVSSGNDASHAVAEYVGGSHDAFVRMMNVKARQLGMSNSRFATPHGLPAADQYTTARDMLILARSYLKRYPQALEFHNMRSLTHRGNGTFNRNPLLGQFPGADGLKSGWIRASGYNLIFTASRGERRLLAVIMGAPDAYVRGNEACRLLEAGFQAAENLSPTVTAALEAMPESPYKLIIKSARKKAPVYTDRYLQRRQAYYAGKGRLGRGLAANPRLAARRQPAKSAKRQQPAKYAKKPQAAPKKRQHAARKVKRSQSG